MVPRPVSATLKDFPFWAGNHGKVMAPEIVDSLLAQTVKINDQRYFDLLARRR